MHDRDLSSVGFTITVHPAATPGCEATACECATVKDVEVIRSETIICMQVCLVDDTMMFFLFSLFALSLSGVCDVLITFTAAVSRDCWL